MAGCGKGRAAVCADWADISSRVSLCIFHGDSAESVLLLRIRHGRTGCVFARKSAGQAGRAEKKTKGLCFIFSHLPPPAPGAGGHPVWPIRELRAVCVPGPHQIPVRANYTTDLTYCILSFFSFCRIKHPNIVSLEDIFESKSHLYLVMQL